MTVKDTRPSEKTLYEPIATYLHSAFCAKFGNCYLEITASGRFSQTIKSAVRQDITFSFLGKKASPDLVGFVDGFTKDFVVAEIKRGEITLQDVYQAKMYGDLFRAKYSLLVSPKPVPEEIKRLNTNLSIFNRFMSGWKVDVGQWDEVTGKIIENTWYPESPFHQVL